MAISAHLIRLLTAGALSGAQISQAWPIGSIFMSTLATNPSVLLGFGSWTAFGAGRVPVGQDIGQTEFDSLEETGGAKTHTLTTDEMPSHTHTYTQPDGPVAAGLAGIVNRVTDVTASVATGSAGNNQAHNNLQPYIVVKMWKRTA